MKLLVATSTFPVSDDDKVPAFVKDQVVEFKKLQPKLEITVLAPHNYHSDSVSRLAQNDTYTEKRFHYFRPYRWELLVGRGIMPALRENKMLYLQIPFFVFFQFVSLLRTTRQIKPDLIYVHWFMPQAISAMLVSKLTRTPYVFTTHASDVAVLYKFPFTKRLIRSVCRNALAYTAVSQRTTDKLKQAFNEVDWNNNYADKLSIIPMGVNVSTPNLSDKTVESVRVKYGLPNDKKMFVFIGRLAEKKGVSYLLKSLPLLDKKILTNSHFVIAGDGQLKRELEQQAKKLKLKNVTFTGYVHGEDKDSLLRLANYMVFPSIIDSMNDSEGFPVAIMESLAAGKVVLGSNVSGAETIFKNGTNGFVFEEKSAKSLAQAVSDVYTLSPSEKTRIEKASLGLAKRYSWGKIAGEHLEVLEQGLQNHHEKRRGTKI